VAHQQSFLCNTAGIGGRIGAVELRSDVEGLILIGRRSKLSDSDNALRSQMSHDLNIAIHTYDYILDVARSKVEMFANRHKKRKGKPNR